MWNDNGIHHFCLGKRIMSSQASDGFLDLSHHFEIYTWDHNSDPMNHIICPSNMLTTIIPWCDIRSNVVHQNRWQSSPTWFIRNHNISLCFKNKCIISSCTLQLQGSVGHIVRASISDYYPDIKRLWLCVHILLSYLSYSQVHFVGQISSSLPGSSADCSSVFAQTVAK